HVLGQLDQINADKYRPAAIAIFKHRRMSKQRVEDFVTIRKARTSATHGQAKRRRDVTCRPACALYMGGHGVLLAGMNALLVGQASCLSVGLQGRTLTIGHSWTGKMPVPPKTFTLRNPPCAF